LDRGVSSCRLFVFVLILVVAAGEVLSQRSALPALGVGKLSDTSFGMSCTYYISPSGSDGNAGTFAEPWRTVQKAFETAAAGETVCLRGGTYPQYVHASAGFNQVERLSGTPGKPILFTNYPDEIAVIQGSTKVYGSNITLRGTPNDTRNCSGTHPCGLIFEGSTGYVLNAVSIMNSSGAGHVTFDHVEIRGGNYHAGLYQEGCNNVITGSYVHDNGIQNRDEDNGIYWSRTPPECKNGGLITNNLVEHNFSKGIQLYAGASASTPAYVTVCGNISVNNGAQGAVIWGDYNTFVGNILYNNNEIAGAAAGAQAGLYSGTANFVDHNLTWSTSDRSGKKSGWFVNKGCCLKDNLIADPSFLDPPRHNWEFKPSSPANQWASRDCTKLKESKVENYAKYQKSER
jgi:Right handed beta helix region